MKMPEVTAIIAAYNAQRYVEQAVRSVLEQTVEDLEVLVVDDGSTDETPEIIRRFDDPRVRIFRQPNAGQTVAKNRGIYESTGRYVGFCDADDRWHPQKLEKQLPVFDRSAEIAVVYSSERSIDEVGNSIPDRVDAVRRGRVLDDLFIENFVPFGTAIVRRSCLLEVGGFDESLRMGIDWDLWLRIAAKYEFDYVPDDLSIYRKWSGQMSTDWCGRYDSAFRIMKKFLRSNPGLLRRGTRRRAYANTYTNRGRARATNEPLAGMIDTLHGLVLDPFTRYSWKSPFMVLRTAAAGLRRQTEVTASK